MRDSDIRSALRRELVVQYEVEPDTRIVEEFVICQGAVRIDVAVINGVLNGYEIKSDQDTLERLPLQQQVYSRVFDRVTVVFSGQRFDKISERVPEWWGIWYAEEHNNSVSFVVVRDANPNPSVDPRSLVQCLWREETLSILKDRGISKELSRSRRSVLWLELADKTPIAELRQLVCSRLKARREWRLDSQPMTKGDLCQS